MSAVKTSDIPKIPVQFEKTLKDYKAAFLKYQELRKKAGVNVSRLDALWKINQDHALHIEDCLIERFGKEVAETMLESVIGWKSLPRA
jgi:hypothetical protein